MTSDARTLSSIAIFGRSHELWPVAALLEKSLPKHIKLTIVEHISAPGPDAALTLPLDSHLHNNIGISTEDLILHCNGTYGLGYDLRDWQGPGSGFFIAPSGKLPAVNGVALHHLMLRAAMMHNEPEKLAYLMQPFRFATRAALAGKFAKHSDDPESPLAVLGPTVQFDRTKYAALLKERCRSASLDIHEVQSIGPVDTDSDGTIISVEIDAGSNVKADLYIDISGLLSIQLPAPKQDRKSLSDILPFDHIISGYDAEKNSGQLNHPVARAISGGLLIDTPLQTGTTTELLFASEILDEQDATALVGETAVASAFAAGYAKQPWTKNLVRLGNASAQLGPFLSADMRLLQEQALHFTSNIPPRSDTRIEVSEFNRQHMASVQQITDFLALPFLLNRRNDKPWADVQNAAPSERLKIRMAQFQNRGRFVTFDNEIFDEQTWIETMIGLGLTPRRYTPLAQALPMKQLAPSLRNMVDAFTNAIDDMPSHADAMGEILDR